MKKMSLNNLKNVLGGYDLPDIDPCNPNYKFIVKEFTAEETKILSSIRGIKICDYSLSDSIFDKKSNKKGLVRAVFYRKYLTHTEIDELFENYRWRKKTGLNRKVFF